MGKYRPSESELARENLIAVKEFALKLLDLMKKEEAHPLVYMNAMWNVIVHYYVYVGKISYDEFKTIIVDMLEMSEVFWLNDK